jgi:hypothetical protein
MRSVFETYISLWPQKQWTWLRPILEPVRVVSMPLPKQIPSSVDVRKTIVVAENTGMKDVMRVLERGFEHVVQRHRADFANELLASCLMIQRPKIFSNDPIGFFLNGLNSSGEIDTSINNLIVEFTSTEDKHLVMEWLNDLLQKDKRAEQFKSIAMQVADEMISNALFNAPVDLAGRRLFQELPRTSTIRYPAKKKSAQLFGSFNENKLIIGCEDPFGSIRRPQVLTVLSGNYSEDMVYVRTEGPGAGVGVRFMIDNSANFCLYCEPNKRTLFACSILLESFKSNFSVKKHLHMSVR